MKRLGKILLILLIATATLVAAGSMAMAQNPMYGNVLTTDSPMSVPAINAKGNILIDNFEYWDNPRDHGWQTNEPDYPVWGNGIGYGNLQTVLDLEQGSRVLDVQMPYSVFLPGNNMKMGIYKSLTECCRAGLSRPLLWISIRAPLEVEQFAMFKLVIFGTTGTYTTPDGLCDPNFNPHPFAIEFSPVGFGCDNTGIEAVDPNQYNFADPQNTFQTPYTVKVPIGRNFQDGSWHTLNANLCAILRKAAQGNTGVGRITGIMIFGNQYRLDNIWLLNDYSPIEGEPPYFFKIGPQFVQVFKPFEYFCYAKDPDLSYRVFLDIWQNEYESTGQAPDPNYVEKLTRQYMKKGHVPTHNGKHEHHGHLSDPDNINPAQDKLFWTATVGGWGAHGSPANMLSEIPIANGDANGDGIPDCDPAIVALTPQLLLNPFKPCMVDLPTLWDPPYDPNDSGEHIAEYNPETIPHLRPGTGGVRIYDPRAVAAYGNYLLKLGFKTWPQMARLYFTPQVLEDLLVTVRVQDSHGRTDLETFPLSIVNYPVTNHPPKLENLDEQAVEVGQTYRYQMVATDQDWFDPGDGSLVADQLNLTWEATIDGLPSYQYGPWSESIINPLTGEITFTPMFEGVYHIVVQVSDPRGLIATGDIPILSTTPGGWLNHRPYIMGDFNDAAPLVIKAGQLFILGPPMLDFHDPDNEELYYSCNIGSILLDKDADGVPRAYWTFQTNFPGMYWVQITAFDQRGAWAVSEFPIDVQPWWSF